MASYKVMSFAIFALVAAALVAANALNPEDSDSSSWFPSPVPCNYKETPGVSCLDCNNKLICTPIGGILVPCIWPGKNNCVDGECGSEPSEECNGTSSTTEEPEIPSSTHSED